MSKENTERSIKALEQAIKADIARIELNVLDEVYVANDELQTFENILEKIKEVSAKVPKKDEF